jgi:hypothetical protein
VVWTNLIAGPEPVVGDAISVKHPACCRGNDFSSGIASALQQSGIVFVSFERDLHLPAKLGITTASLVEERGPMRWLIW